MFRPITYQDMVNMKETVIARAANLMKQQIDPSCIMAEEDRDGGIPVSFLEAVRGRAESQIFEDHSSHPSEATTLYEDTSHSLQPTCQSQEVFVFEEPNTQQWLERAEHGNPMQSGHERKDDGENPLYNQVGPRLAGTISSIESSHDKKAWEMPDPAVLVPEVVEAEISSESTTPLSVADQSMACEDYAMLVMQGGRALIPLPVLPRAQEHPSRYRNRRSAWQQATDGNADLLEHLDFQDIYKLQLHSWENFRYWQYDNRGMDDGSLSSAAKSAFGNRSRHLIYPHSSVSKRFPLKRLEKWEDFCQMRESQRRHHREVAKGSPFPEYVEAVKDRLKRHGFHRLFELREDPEEQSARDTWIEYLNYEYWWCDRRKESRDQTRERCRAAWQKLVDDGYTNQHDDQDSGDMPHGLHDAVDDLERELSDTKRTTPSAYAKIQRLEAQIMAKQIAEMRFRQHHHCFEDLRVRRREFLQQHKRAQWVLEELDVVEEEEQEARLVAKDGVRGEKRKREQEEGLQSRHLRKRARLGDITHDLHDEVRAGRRIRTPEPVLASEIDEENKENSEWVVAPVRYDSESEYSDASYH